MLKVFFFCDIDQITLNETSKNVSDHVAGYIIIKVTETLWRMLRSNILEYETNSAYNAILSMGALKNRCTVAKAFVLLDAPSNVIRRWTLDSKSAGIVILQKFLDSPPILCRNQRDKVIFHLINIICNCFFSAQKRP